MATPSSPQSSTPSTQKGLPDFWSFVEAAQQRISEEFPDTDLLANRLFLSLNRASSTVTYDFESSIHRPAGGTWSSFRLLLAVWVTGPLSPREIARQTGMSRAAVSNLAGTLVGKGLLNREASPQDGRSITLSLTESGRNQVREQFRQQNARESQWAEALTDQEQRSLIALLDKVMSHRKAINARNRR